MLFDDGDAELVEPLLDPALLQRGVGPVRDIGGRRHQRHLQPFAAAASRPARRPYSSDRRRRPRPGPSSAVPAMMSSGVQHAAAARSPARRAVPAADAVAPPARRRSRAPHAGSRTPGYLRRAQPAREIDLDIGHACDLLQRGSRARAPHSARPGSRLSSATRPPSSSPRLGQMHVDSRAGPARARIRARPAPRRRPALRRRSPWPE